MRIIAGAYKGRRLFTPPNLSIRPTSDRVREFIFSCIGGDIENAQVLDLFAGTGAIGLEAKSRGADSVVFVDLSAQALAIIRRNLDMVGLQAPLIKMSADRFLRSVDTHVAYDFIFCDPPYDDRAFHDILDSIRDCQRLKPEGLVIYESSARIEDVQSEGFTIIKKKAMGDSRITFYGLKTSE
ncbi:MAG: 16S rRNA (guanine(966)-N(2))-methyltransferase RsmD [Calditrichaeota bacterium]|nr:MAG: 16S rRNA (guanine(966)-N(2))-methyltransferase RsmD [Calditrichota bacterium]